MTTCLSRPLLASFALLLSLFHFSPQDAAASQENTTSRRPSPIEMETVFNVPGFQGQADHAIENKIKELIQSAVPGSSIRLAIYSFSHRDIAEELVAAHERGVSVEIVMDGKNQKHLQQPGHAIQLLTSTKDGDPALRCDSHSCVHFCSSAIGSGCQGLHINHNKFILFSQLKDGSKNVVAQTSYNFNTSQNYNYNDFIIIKNDSHLYQGFLQYWIALKKGKLKLTDAGTIYGEDGTKAYLFPRVIGSDPVLRILKSVNCKPEGSRIRVLQSRFDGFRDKIAKRLAALRDQGCDVKVIVREEPHLKSPGPSIRSFLGRDLIELRYKDSRGRSLARNTNHSKIVLIEASLNGSDDKTTLVLTGSHNLNITSLRTNDEVLLVLSNQQIYEKYLHFWETLFEDSRKGSFSPALAR